MTAKPVFAFVVSDIRLPAYNDYDPINKRTDNERIDDGMYSEIKTARIERCVPDE